MLNSKSLALASEKANIKIITGDLKVVEKGAADKIFINTSFDGGRHQERVKKID